MNSLIIGKNGLIARHLSNYFNQSKNQSINIIIRAQIQKINVEKLFF